MKSKIIYPMPVDVEEGKIYVWCGCGKTKTPPLCDKTGHCDKAVEYKATLNETLYFCSCRRSQSPPFCDGSHVKIIHN